MQLSQLKSKGEVKFDNKMLWEYKPIVEKNGAAQLVKALSI